MVDPFAVGTPHRPAAHVVADASPVEPAAKPAAGATPGISGQSGVAPAVIPESKKSAQAVIEGFASKAADTAYHAVLAFQNERDTPTTSGEMHKQIVAQLREFAVAAIKTDLALQAMNSEACLRQTANATNRLSELKRNLPASADQIPGAEAGLTRAEFADHRNQAAIIKAEKLQHLDTVDLVDVVAADR
jgi:hypothetical protein